MSDQPGLDLRPIIDEWLSVCGACDAGIGPCTHSERDYRPDMLRLVREVEQLREGRDELLAAALSDAVRLEREVKQLRAELDEWRMAAGAEAELVDAKSAEVERLLVEMGQASADNGKLIRQLREVAGEDVTAYLRDTLDLAPGEVLTAAKVADMWRRGYEQAITHLRDQAEHLRQTPGPLGLAAKSLYYDTCAAYLSARLTEETTP